VRQGPPTSPWATKLGEGFAWLLLVVPVATALERLARGPHTVLFGREAALDYLASLGLVLPAIAFGERPYWLLALIVAALGGWRARRDFSPVHLAQQAFVSAGLVLLFLVSLVAAALWFALAGWWPWLAVGLATALAAGLVKLRRERSPWRARYWQAITATGAAAFVLAAALTFLAAEHAPWERLAPFAAYDAVEYGEAVVATTKMGRGSRAIVLHSPTRYAPLAGTATPQRLVRDAASGTVFLANYGGVEADAVTRLDESGARNLALPGCRQAIDLALWRGTLLVVCEKSYTLHRYDLEADEVTGTWHLPPAPYGLAVDAPRDRAYVTSEFFSPENAVFDLANETFLPPVTLGNINWGVAVERTTGRFFIARPLSGQVLAFDAERRVVGRLHTGAAPRDLALDEKRGLMLVANYLSGNVTVVRLDDFTVAAQLRVGGLSPVRLLRGVEVSPRGAWLATDASGIWRLEPSAVDAWLAERDLPGGDNS
jgi:hypothetical protein